MGIETVAVIASSAVAIAAIVFGWLQHRGDLQHQLRLADLASVRGVLDDAAALLHRVAYVLDEVRSGVTQHSPTYFKTEGGTETFIKLGGLGQEADALTARLSVRSGRRHKVVSEFSAASEAALAIYRAAGLVRLEPEPDGSPAAAHAIQRFHDETRAKLKDGRERFDQARERFADAAHRTAGASLPGE